VRAAGGLGFQRPPEIGRGLSTSSAGCRKIVVHDHILEPVILKVALTGIALALCLTGCPLSLGGDDEADSADGAVSRTRPDEDTAQARNDCQPEGAVCNGVDDDCDGLIDEGCGLRLGGHVLGAGFVSATDGGVVLAGVTATRHFIGTSSDGAWVIRGGLPPAGEAP
jgi:hypothetical protein